jgi:hypothetical protein
MGLSWLVLAGWSSPNACWSIRIECDGEFNSLIDMLEVEGATVLGPLGWLDEAVVFLGRDSAFDGTVLDVNLHGQSSYPIADALIERGVQFVFATGYNAEPLSEPYRAYPRCEKPLHKAALIAALARPAT